MIRLSRVESLPIAIPAHTRLFDLIRAADAAFTNLQVLFHYDPMNESGGTYVRAEPALLKHLVWAGFDSVSMTSNPHARLQRRWHAHYEERGCSRPGATALGRISLRRVKRRSLTLPKGVRRDDLAERIACEAAKGNKTNELSRAHR